MPATTSEGRTALNNQTVRTVYLIGPDKLVKAMLVYPMSTGRNFNEVLRLLNSCQLTAGYKVATPVNWTQGEDVIIVPSVPDEEARKLFPDGWQAVTPYMRVVPQPGGEEAMSPSRSRSRRNREDARLAGPARRVGQPLPARCLIDR